MTRSVFTFFFLVISIFAFCFIFVSKFGENQRTAQNFSVTKSVPKSASKAARYLNESMFELAKLEKEAFFHLRKQIDDDLLNYEMQYVVKNAYKTMLDIASSNLNENALLADLLIEASENFKDSNQMFKSLFVTHEGIFSNHDNVVAFDLKSNSKE